MKSQMTTTTQLLQALQATSTKLATFLAEQEKKKDKK
jgi:hypothetical protein